MISNQVDTLKYIGKETSEKLKKVNIHTVEDLLYTYPKAYEDYIVDNSKSVCIATIKTSPKTTSFRISKTTFNIEVNGLKYLAIAYRQPYLSKLLKIGDIVIMKANYDVKKRVYLIEKIRPIKKLDHIESQYKLPDIQDYIVRKALDYFFNQSPHKPVVHDFDSKAENKGYYSLFNALKAIHLPLDYDTLANGWRSLKLYDAIKFLQLANKKKQKFNRPNHEIDFTKIEHLYHQLPFQLTEDQHQAIQSIILTCNQDSAIEYLIQGDVGSGKTIVAFILAIAFIQKGYQVAFMAPTEILAKQHYESFNQLFDITNVLLTGSTKNKKRIKSDIEQHRIMIIFGTHALISKDVHFKRLGLVIIDEQHKFGVSTRQALVKKSLTKDLLYLSATPIPRSLMHIFYGHAEVVNIHSMPQGRQRITTKSIHNQMFQSVIGQLQKAVDHHQHVFVVVPSIASNRSTYNILNVYQHLTKLFGQKLFVIHGQMRQEEQEISMQSFKNSLGGVLLSTSMIEVGVNIPTATFMVILDANFFGLSQLHQLRGRIGRGTLKGVCYLLSDDPEHERMKQLETIQDGFEISELDLTLRGPGKLFGTMQSGNFKEGLIHIVDDLPILKEAKDILSQVS
ncbi:MAG: DEAD/DEAH box helicase [Acholeplasmataceae bacterium]